MASQVHVSKIYEGSVLGPTSARGLGGWNVEEDDIVGQLNDSNFKKRLEILEHLTLTVKTNGGHLPYSDHESIFRGLGLALSDPSWEIRLKCIVLVQELIPNLRDDLDHCMALVINKLVSNIGDNKVTLRKAVISNLHRYMKHTQNMPALLHEIVNTGLENENAKVRREMIGSLPMLLTRDILNANLHGIIQSLAKKLLDTSTENNLKDVSLSTLQAIENLLGEDQFDGYIQRLSPSLRKYYQKLAGKTDHGFRNETRDHPGTEMYTVTAHQNNVQETIGRQDTFTDHLEFDCIPAHIVTRINEQEDFKTRAQAVEDLKGVILSLTPDTVRQKLLPHIIPLLSFLNSLLEDSNFKIITVTLEILYSLVEQMGGSLKNCVKNIVTILTKRMGDNKIVIRQSVMRVMIKVMRCSSPKLVISAVCDNLSHRNSRVRQEAVNIIIAALLTFPRYEFELPSICLAVGPTLIDIRRQVRQAALECFALLAQALGPGHLQPLVHAIDQVEVTSDGEGLMAAVQARLARRQLPRLNGEGLVEYAVSVPSSAAQRLASDNWSADTEWVLAARSGSAHTVRSEHMDLESVISSSTRSAPGRTDSNIPTHAPRRIVSAGRSRSKLPWEENPHEGRKASGDLVTSAMAQNQAEGPAPSRPHDMWMGDAGYGALDGRKTPTRATATSTFSLLHDQAASTDNDNGYTRPEQRTPRKVLDPISVKPARATVDTYRQDKGDSGTQRAAWNRGSATYRGHSRVPAIPPSAAVTAVTAAVPDDGDDADSAYSASASSTSSTTGSQRGPEGYAKNKAQQQVPGTERQSDPRAVADYQQGQRNAATNVGASVTDPSGKSIKMANAVDVRHKPSQNLDINENKSSAHPDDDPTSRVSFRENGSSGGPMAGQDRRKDGLSTTEAPAGDRRRASREKGEEKGVDPPRSTAVAAAAGIRVRGATGFAGTEVDSTTTEDDSEEETAGLEKSSSFQRSVARKQRVRQGEEGGPRQDRLQPEPDGQQQRHRLTKLGSSDSLSEAFSTMGSDPSSPSNLNTGKTLGPRPAVTPRRTLRTGGEAERSPEGGKPTEDWKPFSDPEAALRAAHRKMENDDWEVKTEGLNMTRRIVHFHPETFGAPPVLHSTILLVVREVKNLRSQVSRQAIVCLGDMFGSLGKAMDPDVDIVACQLLAKAGESNNFIRDDVERSLCAMVEGVAPKQALLALIGGGASHKNIVVRRTAAQFLVGLVERMGSGRILSGVKDITERVLPATAQFVLDGSPETRYYGRKILHLLMPHQDFSRMLTRHLPPNTLRNVQDVVDSLKNKGLGEKPNETASARSRRSGQGSRMGSSLRRSSANSADLFSNTPPTRRRPARTDEATMNEIKTLTDQLSSSEWRVRYDAVTAFQDLCVERPHTVSLHMVKILDKLLPLVQAANSKVSLQALRALQAAVPHVQEALQAVASMAVAAVAPNLASKNRPIADTARSILDSFLQHLDQAVLIQPFANQAQCAAGHSKAEMVLKVAYLTDRVYERKGRQVVLHVLPLLWHLLSSPGAGTGSASGKLCSATAALAATLHSHMGQGLLDRAGSEPSLSARHLSLLQEML